MREHDNHKGKEVIGHYHGWSIKRGRSGLGPRV